VGELDEQVLILMLDLRGHANAVGIIGEGGVVVPKYRYSTPKLVFGLTAKETPAIPW